MNRSGYFLLISYEWLKMEGTIVVALSAKASHDTLLPQELEIRKASKEPNSIIGYVVEFDMQPIRKLLSS